MFASLCFFLPVCVVLFWGIYFAFGKPVSSKNTDAEGMLSAFFFCQFVLHAYRVGLYAGIAMPHYMSVAYHAASILIISCFYIYILLLTEADSFSIRSHVRFFVPSIVWIVLYISVVSVIPYADYELFAKLWVRPQTYSVSIIILQGLMYLKLFLYLAQGIGLIYMGIRKIQKKDLAAQHYFSNIKKSIGYTISEFTFLIIGLAAVTLALILLGAPLLPDVSLLSWVILKLSYSVVLFCIGFYAIDQNSRMASFAQIWKTNMVISLSPQQDKAIGIKMKRAMEEQKQYLNAVLNIKKLSDSMDVSVEQLHEYIRKHYRKTFYYYINEMRINEMYKSLRVNPKQPEKQLANVCGFTSVREMHTVLYRIMHLNMNEYRNLLKE